MILLTGADGFVGTHLKRELMDAGHQVLSTDRPDHDLAEPGEAARLIDETLPQYVVHLAARYGRLLCRDEPHKAVSDNTAATTELAAACAERGIPILYTSTSEVYGDHGEDVITEDSELRMPTTVYGLSKRWAEEALRLYMDPGKLCIVRLNMLFGPEQRAGYGCCALATFVKKALEGEPFTVHRDASRSWLYITDAVRALRLLIEGGHTGVYNLSNEHERIGMGALAEMVVSLTGAGDDAYEIEDAPAHQIKHKQYRCSKLRETIDWKPEVHLMEGIRNTVESQRRVPVHDYAAN